MTDNLQPISGEARAIAKAEQALGGPVTFSSLVKDLRALNIPANPTVIVHSSASSLGWVAGGPVTVVDALIEALGPGATIVMPAQSGHYTDPINWGNPPVPPHWVDIIRAEMPAFDPARVPTRGMGQIVEAFRTLPGTLRSAHPTVSFVARGPLATHILEPHELSPQFGETSPLGRLYEADAIILLLGVTHGNDTSLHFAEVRAQWPGKPEPVSDGSAVLVNGERRWVDFTNDVADETDFEVLGDAFAATGREHTGRVGAGTTRWCRMTEMVDFAVNWMSANRPASLNESDEGDSTDQVGDGEPAF